MSGSPKQTPLGINVLGSLLQNSGFTINPVVSGYVGTSKINEEYSPGSLVNDTCLKYLTYAIHDAYIRGEASANVIMSNCTIQNNELNTTLTVGEIESGIIKAGMELTDAQGRLKANTSIIACLSGSGTTPGSVWQLNRSQVSGDVPSGVLTNAKLTGTIANTTVTANTYGNLISFASNTIPALGNYPPSTYIIQDPSNVWHGEATSGYSIPYAVGQGQEATWLPYDLTNPNHSVTEWGFLRLLALQGWNEFNFNGAEPNVAAPEYKDYSSSFMSADSFVKDSNKTINAMNASKTFLKGTFSNMNDLMTGDVSGVNQATPAFGRDFQNLGKAFNMSKIASFGLPSNLLMHLKENNAITNNLNLALLSAELTSTDIQDIHAGKPATKEQEQKIYGAFLVMVGTNLSEVTQTLQCNTPELTSVADLLNVKKLFPNSYKSMTVPVYNAEVVPTNSKTYYLMYTEDATNAQLTAPPITAQIGTQVVTQTAVVANNQSTVSAVDAAIIQASATNTAQNQFSGGHGGGTNSAVDVTNRQLLEAFFRNRE